MSDEEFNGYLKKGNRKVVIDYYVPDTIENINGFFDYKVFIRLTAKKIKFIKVRFLHCIFESCYLNSCVFDSCDFTGCKFIGSNFHQTAFSGCIFRFTTFERTFIDDEILISEAPLEENLKMQFARSLRTNYQQIGDSKSVNKAIMIELRATSDYLLKSWKSGETYYRKKFSGFDRIKQFFRWFEFELLHIIWGNGESVLKFLRTIAFILFFISIYDTYLIGKYFDLSQYWTSFLDSPAIFLGVNSPKHFSVRSLSLIMGVRFVSFALLTTLLVKRFSRR